ncbi:MAG: hypothetical protein JW712_11505 [Dehalococcoidales bacterium]|nr:hypothetical protein [Dehalococcoidales bacterium]
MVKWKANSCLRCGGTTYLEKDGDETWQKCLMCSHSIQIKPKLKETAEVKEKEAPVKS